MNQQSSPSPKKPRFRSRFKSKGFWRKLTRKPWFSVALLVLAAADLFLVVFPIEGLALASVMAHPRRWLRPALSMALGSTLGCIALAQMTYVNAPWVLEFLGEHWGGLTQSAGWAWVQSHIDQWGAAAVLAGTFTPIPLQVLVVAPALAGLRPEVLFSILAAGRFSRGLLLCWVGSHASGAVLKQLAHYRQADRELKDLDRQ